MTLRIVMMGTGRFALPTFLGLYDTNHEVVGLLTKPDKQGLGHHRHENLLKTAAEERGTPVFQPENVNEDESIAVLSSLGPDLLVVAAYGQILRERLLQIPRLGSINVHASLLPKYRGAAPIQYAILNGETETGISVFQIEPRLDAGPILGMQKIDIGLKETSGELEQRLAQLAPPLTIRVIDGLDAGTITAIRQEHSSATKAPRIKKSEGAINWTQSANHIARQIRAMQPWPKAYSYLHQAGKKPKRLILLDSQPTQSFGTDSPGQVLEISNKHFAVQAGDRPLMILRLQPEGKRAMSTDEFLRGHSITVGNRMNSETRGD